MRRFLFYWEGTPHIILRGIECPDGGRVVVQSSGEVFVYDRATWENHAIKMSVVVWLDPPA